MKKWLSVCLSILFLLTMLPLGALSAVMAEGAAESVVLNVKDFGAVGDGKTDDEAAIWATFECALMEYMIYDIPVTVYFPEGQYGLTSGGLYVYLPRGAGNLTIKGDGADKSTIVYLEEWTNSGSWVALRIYPRITPTSVDEYLHDITIQDLGVYDTDPVAHAWHTDKGDPGTEETHGFNIQHCVRATIKNCKAVDVGDECFDFSHCIDSVMTENLVIKNRITGKGGGSFSVGDGSRNVVMNHNTVIFNSEDPNTGHYGFAVEALAGHIQDVSITDNVVQNINGWGVNIGLPSGTADQILVQNNTFTDCHNGGVRFTGTGLGTNIKVSDNYIANARYGILLDGSNKVGAVVENCTIENVSTYGVSVGSTGHRDTVIRNVVIRNASERALYNAGTNTLFERVLVDGSGTAGNVTDSAVIQYAHGGDCTISNSIFLNCQNKRGIQGAAKVINTYIQQPEISGYTAITGVAQIQNCWVNRAITLKSGATVDDLTLYATADLGTHAIVLSNLTDCTVTNCRITVPSRYGISEAGTADRNTITNNVIIGGSGIKTVGADTVAADNVRSTLMVGEQFTYRVVDGAVTVMAPVDSALTTLDIPAAIDGYPVVAIDPWAFALCDALQSVSIPAGVTAIGDYAFYRCEGLTQVFYGGLTSQRPSVAVGAENGILNDADWAYHWNNHDYDNDCDPDCNGCDFVREVGDHIYDGICDAACNSCGVLREVPDHTYESEVTAPDCVNGGYTTYICTVCGDSYVGDETAALGHAYESEVTAPDCVNGGYTTYTCTVCGDSYVGDETATLDHSYKSVVIAPDCVNGGYTTYICTVCGDSYIGDEIAALDHSYKSVVIAPDCVNGGYTTYICTVCGDSYVADEVAALGHVYESEVTAPDCVNGGYTTYTCTVCGDSYVDDETATLDHTYESVVIAPDCMTSGYTIYICTVCGDSYVTDETAALGHTYESEATAPDCVNGGYTTYTCTVCGDSYVTDETAALDHTYDNACDAACNACGEVREVPEHVYDDDTDTDCNECGFVREVTIVILGDADGNGKVNNRDLGLLQLYLNDDDLSGKSFDAAACDMDGNGKLNNRDLGLLQRLLNG